MAAAWQGTWHEGQGTLGKALEAQLGACCPKWFSCPGGLVPVCVCVCIKARKGPSALLPWDAAFSAVLSMVTRALICTSRNINQVWSPPGQQCVMDAPWGREAGRYRL